MVARFVVMALLVAGCGAPRSSSNPDALLALPDAPPADTVADATPGPCQVDTDCADPYSVCDTGATPHACVCAAGYAADPQGACAWAGVIANPGCSMQGGWSLQGNTRVDDTRLEVGMVDLGACAFETAAPEGEQDCDGIILRFDQTIVMPRRSRAAPLVVQASYRDSSDHGFGPLFGVGSSWSQVPNPQIFGGTGYLSARSCLGAGGYAPESTTGPGAPRRFSMLLNAPTVCLHESEIFVDRVDILPAAPGECAAPGSALNGDAEGPGGWRFETSGGATAALAEGAGAHGSRGVALHLDERCDLAAATDPISIPVALSSPALRFYARASAGADLRVSFEGPDGGLLIGSAPSVRVTGDGATRTVCIPAYLRGAAMTFQARLAAPDVSNGCADAVGLDAAIDDVAIVDDPSCGTDPAFADGGFESTNLRFGRAAVVHDASLAHSGAGAVELAIDGGCKGSSWSARVSASTGTATEGPALAFYYRAPPGTAAYLGVAGAIDDGQWHRGVKCLDPRTPDVPQDVWIGYAPPAPTPATCTPVNAYLDDVTVTTDPSCGAP